MTVKNELISQITLAEHFSIRLTEEAKEIRPALSSRALVYMNWLLNHFHQSSQLFDSDDKHQFSLPTLALLYRDALQAQTRFKKIQLLKKLGDSALFSGALFFEHFASKGIRKDYFIGMGSGAYSSLGSYQHTEVKLYKELAERFPQLLQLIAAVCAQELKYNSEEIFALIERWQQSKDETLQKQLYAMGIHSLVMDRRH